MRRSFAWGPGLFSLALATGALCSACSGALADGDGHAFGDDMGRFHVTAHLDSSTCGPQAMDAPENWEFDVVLSQKAPTIYWNTGANAVEGQLAADGKTFSFSSETVVNVGATGTPPPPASATCAVVRTDGASGTLDSAKSASAFAGNLDYSFSPQGNSDCTSLLSEGGFATLPCSMSYRMTAAWVSAR